MARTSNDAVSNDAVSGDAVSGDAASDNAASDTAGADVTDAAGAVPAVRAEAERRARLSLMRRRATVLLAAVTVVFLTVTIWGGDAGWAGYVQATAEAAMIGGLADWFAVVALFRHPLGIPIPHTAIIVERKDQFGATLGQFIQDTFLTSDAVVERIRSAEVVGRSADWLAEPEHASRVAGEVLDGAVNVADLVRDDDVHRVVEGALRQRVDDVALAPLAGRGLDLLIRDGRHQQALDAGLRELDTYLEANREQLRGRLGSESPWWLPNAAEDRIFDRLVDGARAVIAEMLEDREHHLRRHLQTRLVQLAEDLQTSDEYLAAGERLKHEVLSQPQVQAWVSTLWGDVKDRLRSQAADPESDLRHQIEGVVVAAGERLRSDPALATKVEDAIVRAASALVDRFRGEIGELVSGTISRWDASETADRLELLLGPDLQFIRINGTVVGAMAGLLLYSIGQWLG